MVFINFIYMHPYIALSIAIFSEVIATSALRATAGFTKFVPSIIVVVGYFFAFLFLSVTLNSIPVGVAYAIWSGLGMVLVSVIAYFFYNQVLNFPTILGIVLILIGVLILHLFTEF